MIPSVAADLRARIEERAVPTTGADDPTLHSVDVERSYRLAVRAHGTALRALLLDAERSSVEPALDLLRRQVQFLLVAALVYGAALSALVLAALALLGHAIWSAP